MKQPIFTLLVICILSFNAFSQDDSWEAAPLNDSIPCDTLYTKDGRSIPAKVTETTLFDIHYRSCDKNDTISHWISKKELLKRKPNPVEKDESGMPEDYFRPKFEIGAGFNIAIPNSGNGLPFAYSLTIARNFAKKGKSNHYLSLRYAGNKEIVASEHPFDASQKSLISLGYDSEFGTGKVRLFYGLNIGYILSQNSFAPYNSTSGLLGNLEKSKEHHLAVIPRLGVRFNVSKRLFFQLSTNVTIAQPLGNGDFNIFSTEMPGISCFVRL